MSCYTCLTCKVSFASNEWQKQHYKSEWHQYNLKRRVAGLPAVSFEAFEKLKSKQRTTEDGGNRLTSENNYCNDCRKLFSSEKSYEQHCQSRKHREGKARISESPWVRNQVTKLEIKNTEVQPNFSSAKKGLSMEVTNVRHEVSDNAKDFREDDDSDWESIDDDHDPDAQPIPPNQCFFCSLENPSIEDNIEHMSSAHSFFIPDFEFIVDIEGLLTYLGEKLAIDRRCLWCSYSGKSFRSIKSVQQHMLSKGHSKINFEQADVLLEYADFYDYSKSYPDTNSSDPQEEISIPVLTENENWQLVLPSGAVVGHRALFQYYKQNLRPITERTGTSASQRIIDKVMSNYKALGWTGVKGEAAVARAKDMQFYNRIRSKRDLKQGLRGNVTLQTHFRSQVFF